MLTWYLPDDTNNTSAVTNANHNPETKMTSKQVIRGTFGQKGDDWFSYWRDPTGRHVLIQSSRVIGSSRTIGSFQTKRELVKRVSELAIEPA